MYISWRLRNPPTRWREREQEQELNQLPYSRQSSLPKRFTDAQWHSDMFILPNPSCGSPPRVTAAGLSTTHQRHGSLSFPKCTGLCLPLLLPGNFTTSRGTGWVVETSLLCGDGGSKSEQLCMRDSPVPS